MTDDRAETLADSVRYLEDPPRLEGPPWRDGRQRPSGLAGADRQTLDCLACETGRDEACTCPGRARVKTVRVAAPGTDAP